jgi:3-deoxy-D-manno-octulosonic-acid transferase
MAATFNAAVAIGVQAEVYAARLRRLGCHAGRIRVTGQMKHDVVTFIDTVPGAAEMAREVGLGPDDAVFVAASTAPEETETLIEAYRTARRTQGRLRLVIVPRRPESFEATADGIRAAGLAVVRRSRSGEALAAAAGEPPVVIGDTMGEMMKWYALARIIFVGRSLVHLGGSNPMEPGALARPLLWGPEMFNFPVEAPALVEAGAARVVRDAADMAAAVEELLTRPETCRQMGEAARATIRRMQGATARSIELVRETLGGTL